MPEFTSCSGSPITFYEVIEETTLNLHTSLSVNQSGTELYISPNDKTAIAEYKFRIRATKDDEIFTSISTYTLRVGCGNWQIITQDPSF
jgi:hypothetical protein